MSIKLSKSLIDCCRSGNVEAVKKILIDRKLPDFSRWVEAYVLLCVSLQSQQTEVAKFLLKNNATINIEGTTTNTPLHHAVNTKNTKILHILLDKKADLNAKNAEGKTPLHLAVENNHISIVNILIHNGALEDISLTSYYSILDIAVCQGNHKILQLLLKNINNSESTTNKDVDFRKLEEEEPERKRARKCKKDIKSKEEAPNSPKNKSKIRIRDVVELDENLKINFRGLLHKAIRNINQTEQEVKKVVKVLLNNNFNVNANDRQGESVLYYGFIFSYFEVCKYLIKRGASFQVKENQNLLCMSVQRLNVEFTKFLLEEGADVNGRTKDGSTSLHIACRIGNQELTELLLKHNNGVNLEDREGLTPLHQASKQKDPSIVNLLLNAGSLVNQPSRNSMTPLHFAVLYGQKDIVKSLAEFGADLKANNNKLKTALCLAVEAGKTDIIRVLLDQNPDLQDENNKLALCFAIVKNGSEKIVELFLMRGFTIQSKDFNSFSVPEPLYSKYSMYYSDSKYQAVFRDLLNSKPSINGLFEYQVLRNSVKRGFCKIVQSLLKSEAKIDTLLEDGISLLHVAVSCRRISTTKGLLCNPHGHVGVDVIRFLLDAGADINCKDFLLNTPLHHAVLSDNQLVLEFLLEYHADVNVKNIDNETQLDLALFRDWKYAVYILLDQGAVFDSSIVSTYNDSEILDAIQKQIIKLEAVKEPYVVKDFVEYFMKDFNEDYVDNPAFISECYEEIRKMIKHSVGKHVSLYDLLVKKDFEVEVYLKNKQILHFLKSNDIENLYPVYCSWLQIRIDRAKGRNSLMVAGSNSLEYVLQIGLPHIVIQKICSYFTNSDLRKLTYMSKFRL